MKSISLHLLMNILVSCLALSTKKQSTNRTRLRPLVRPSTSKYIVTYYKYTIRYTITLATDQDTKSVNARISYNTGKYIFSL